MNPKTHGGAVLPPNDGLVFPGAPLHPARTAWHKTITCRRCRLKRISANAAARTCRGSRVRERVGRFSPRGCGLRSWRKTNGYHRFSARSKDTAHPQAEALGESEKGLVCK